jgi:hypothetical protein
MNKGTGSLLVAIYLYSRYKIDKSVIVSALFWIRYFIKRDGVANLGCTPQS